MSKSNSSTRSNSMETPDNCDSELNSPQGNVPAILEGSEGQETIPSSPPPSYEFVLEEGVSKLLPIVLSSKSIIFLLDGLKEFWPTKNSYVFLARFMRSYGVMEYLALTLLITKSIVIHEPLFKFRVPDFPNSFWIMANLQYFQFIFDATYVYGLDMLFICSCVIIRQQFKYLGDGFRKIGEGNNLDETEFELKKCMKHHAYMIRYANVFIDVFSPAMLLQYMISTYSFCMELLVLPERKNAAEIMSGSLYTLAVLCQLTISCFLAEEVTTCVSEVSETIYATKWYNFNVKIQKYYPLMIALANKPVKIRGGSILYINRAAFKDIFTSALSFYTLVNKVREKR